MSDTSIFKKDLRELNFTRFDLIGLVFVVLAMLLLSNIKSAVHEIEFLLLLLIAAVNFVGSGIIRAIRTSARSDQVEKSSEIKSE